jgi:predicted nuclease of restriction endonuclease-like (RecB) superfamily
MLGWSHYLILMRIANPDERRFYEIEATQSQWSFRKLQREYGSSLYERLALSRDKDAVMKLSTDGQTVEHPRDILKNPLVLDFLDMEERTVYSEDDLETAIIDKLEKFLLEMGKGFLFEARQKPLPKMTKSRRRTGRWRSTMFTASMRS